MKKKLMAVLTALVLVVSLLPTALAAGNLPFTDVADDFWAEDEISWAYEEGLMNGNSATTFNPGGNVTRQQVWMILARMSGYAPEDMAAAKGWAVSTGVSDGSNPGNAVTRQQLVTLIWRAEGEPKGDVSVLADYPDAASVAAYAQEAMAWSVENGVVGGTTQGTLNPAGTANRAQLAVILFRYCGQEVEVTEEYTVTFKLNYGDEGTYKTVTVEDGDTLSKITNPSRSGYSFKGWYTKATGGEKFDFSTEITKDITLYAQWTKVSSGSSGHSHYYTTWTSNNDGTHTGTCGCSATYTQSCTVVDEICTKCGASYPTTVDGLQDALNKGGYIQLSEDVTVTETLVIPEGVTVVLDLNGKSITGTAGRDDNNNRIHTLVNNGTLTITGGSVKSTGTNGGAAISNNGILILDGVTIVGAPSDTATGYAAYAVNTQGEGSKTTVVNANISGRGAIGASDGATVVIEDGTFCSPVPAWGHCVYADGEGTSVVINGGAYSEGFDSAPNDWTYMILAGNGAVVTVNSGTFTAWDSAAAKDFCELNGNGTIEFLGGTFETNPSEWVAEGYKALSYGSSYKVVSEDIDKLIPGTTIELVEGSQGGTIYLNSAEDFWYLNKLTDKDYWKENIGEEGCYYYQWGWKVVLNCDVNLENKAWTPVDISQLGGFDGQGHTINNLNVTGTNRVGLFSESLNNDSGKCPISNLVIDGATVTGDQVVGVLIGYATTPITNVTIKNATVNGKKYVGGLVGKASSSITNCSVIDSSVVTTTRGEDNKEVGGIVGFLDVGESTDAAYTVKVENCAVIETIVSGYDEVGGIAGRAYARNNAKIEFNDNTVDAGILCETDYVGQILGRDFDGTGIIIDGVTLVGDDTADLQWTLDRAVTGTIIQLAANATYNAVYIRPTATNETTMVCETHSYTTTDAAEFKAHVDDGSWHTTPRYITNFKDVTIIGAEGATVAGLTATSGHIYGDVYDYVRGKDYDEGSAYYWTLNISNLTFENVAFTGKVDLSTSDAASVYNGVTFDGCSFTTGGTGKENDAAIHYYNEANNGHVKNITVTGCNFDNCYQGVYVHHVNGVTVTGSTFRTTGHNAIALQGHDGAVNLKNVVITGNTFEYIGDRVIRFNEVGADSNITIQNNSATESGDEDGEVMKATSIASGVVTNISGNTWNGTVVNDELKDQ